MRLSLAADDLFIVPPKWFFVKPYFLEAFELSELGVLQTSQCQLVFSASIGSFLSLLSWDFGSHSFVSALGAQV